jgi:hypothetical protein
MGDNQYFEKHGFLAFLVICGKLKKTLLSVDFDLDKT